MKHIIALIIIIALSVACSGITVYEVARKTPSISDFDSVIKNLLIGFALYGLLFGISYIVLIKA